jgi:hypothetical protein
MRNAEKSTCSAVGNPFEPFLDARISKSISNFASRDRIGKPAFLITRLAQSRRENIKLFLAVRCGVRHVASPKGCIWQDRWGAAARQDEIGHLRCTLLRIIRKHPPRITLQSLNNPQHFQQANFVAGRVRNSEGVGLAAAANTLLPP